LELPHDRVSPGHQLIEPGLRMTVDDAGNDVAQIGVRLDAEQLAAFDQRGEDCPMPGAAIGAGEEGVFAR